MKKLILFLSSLLFCLGGMAQGTKDSEGTLEISLQASLTPGDTESLTFFTIKLNAPNGDNLYTAYQMDIELPSGIYFDETYSCFMSPEIFPIYPSTKIPFTGSVSASHTLACNLFTESTARVLVKSDKSEAFKSREGDLFYAVVKATPFAKPGDFQVTIKDIMFVAPDETKYLYQDQVLTAGTVTAESSIPVKVTSANKISTAIFPFSCTIPDGMEIYTTTGVAGEYITLQKAESIVAFTPYILYSENGIEQSLSGTIDADSYPADGTVSDGRLTGVLHDKVVSAGYVLQNKGDGPHFYKIGDTPFTIPAGKCYANPTPAGAKSLGFHFGEDNPTGITTTTIPHLPTGDIYDLQGRKVLTPQSGQIYVIGGQKYLKR